MNTTPALPASLVVNKQPYGNAALDRFVEEIAHSTRGDRHRTLFIASLKAGSLVAGLELDETRARSRLVSAGMQRGMTRADCERQAKNGMAKGAQNPRSAPNTLRVKTPQQAREWALAVGQCLMLSDASAGTKKVGMALIGVMVHHGRCETSQSFRQVAELAGVSYITVRNHIHRLSPWIRHIKGTLVRSGKWRLLPVQRPVDLTSVVIPDPSANCWHRRPGEWAAYAALHPFDATTLVELARRSGRTLRTIKEYVAGWVAAGLARVVGDEVVPVAGAALPVTAVDHAEKRRRSHVLDRLTWRRRLLKKIENDEYERSLSEDELARIRGWKKGIEMRDRFDAHMAGRSSSSSPPVFGEYPAAA